MDTDSDHQIGTLNEKPLHAALKTHYARPGDRFEVPLDGFHIDLVRGDRLVEFQTGNFGAMKRKLATLVTDHRIRLVHPIAHEKWIVKIDESGRELSRRKSPKRGCVDDVFTELVFLPALLAEENFSLEVLMTREEEVRFKSSRKRRRGGWATAERRLIDVVDRWVFDRPADLADLLPGDLPDAFTTADIARGIAKPLGVAQKMAYCLRHSGALTVTGKQGRSILYELARAV
jgi:hypothetical protein